MTSILGLIMRLAATADTVLFHWSLPFHCKMWHAVRMCSIKTSPWKMHIAIINCLELKKISAEVGYKNNWQGGAKNHLGLVFASTVYLNAAEMFWKHEMFCNGGRICKRIEAGEVDWTLKRMGDCGRSHGGVGRGYQSEISFTYMIWILITPLHCGLNFSFLGSFVGRTNGNKNGRLSLVESRNLILEMKQKK